MYKQWFIINVKSSSLFSGKMRMRLFFHESLCSFCVLVIEKLLVVLLEKKKLYYTCIFLYCVFDQAYHDKLKTFFFSSSLFLLTKSYICDRYPLVKYNNSLTKGIAKKNIVMSQRSISSSLLFNIYVSDRHIYYKPLQLIADDKKIVKPKINQNKSINTTFYKFVLKTRCMPKCGFKLRRS